MTWPRPIRVVGVGSPRGDDGLAWDVVRKVRERRGFRPELEFYTVEGGQRILDVLDGRGTLLLVDAVRASTRPGTIHRFEWPDDRIESLRPGSTHDMRPAEALRLASVLGIAPARVIVFGIEAETIDPQQGLSQPVLAAVPELVRRLLNELEGGSIVEGHLPRPAGEEH
jgi:hydrogenase maturation protease